MSLQGSGPLLMGVIMGRCFLSGRYKQGHGSRAEEAAVDLLIMFQLKELSHDFSDRIHLDNDHMRITHREMLK